LHDDGLAAVVLISKGKSMFRAVLTVAVILGVTGIVLAQVDPVALRKELMRANGARGYGTFPKMLRGQEPYDQAKVDQAFAQLIDVAKKLPPLFPAGTEGATRPGSDYFASPKIWQNKSDFDGRFAKYAEELPAAKAKATSLEGLKEAFAMVRRNCDSCHDDYMVRK
jgi:cytochrome c556